MYRRFHFITLELPQSERANERERNVSRAVKSRSMNSYIKMNVHWHEVLPHSNREIEVYINKRANPIVMANKFIFRWKPYE